METPLPERPPGDSPGPAGTATLEAAGFGAAVDAFAWEPAADADPPRMRLWLLSLLGPQQAVKALWVRLVRGEIATMRVPDASQLHAADGGSESTGAAGQSAPVEALATRVRFCALAPEGPRRWRLFAAALPASAGCHGLLVPEAALVGADRPDFLIFPRTPEEAAPLHYRFLNRRQDLPLHPAWADWLWERALRRGEAAPLESRGLLAYRCTPEAQALADDLGAGVRRGELDVPEGSEGPEDDETVVRDRPLQEAAG